MHCIEQGTLTFYAKLGGLKFLNEIIKLVPLQKLIKKIVLFVQPRKISLKPLMPTRPRYNRYVDFRIKYYTVTNPKENFSFVLKCAIPMTRMDELHMLLSKI